jgi:glycosyltransferase involved in cell wall biosynthesis
MDCKQISNSQEIIKLSIIIPVYNVEAFIRQCLDSIFTEENATLPYEVIVVNDGTPDNSMAIVEEYVTKHPNLHVVRQENHQQYTYVPCNIIYFDTDLGHYFK